MAQVHVACQRCNLCAINTFKARPHPLPPTHPSLPAHFSIFPFLCSWLPVFLFPDLLSAPSSPLSAGVDCSRSYPSDLAVHTGPVYSAVKMRQNDGTDPSGVAFYLIVLVFSDNKGVLITWLISSIPLLANSKTSSLGWTAVVMAVEFSKRSLRIPAPNKLLALFLHVSTHSKSPDPLI